MINGVPGLQVFLMPVVAVPVGLSLIFFPIGAYFLGSSSGELSVSNIIMGAILWGAGWTALLVGIHRVIFAIADTVAEPSNLAGTVSHKAIVEGYKYEFDEDTYYLVWVQDRAFKVSEDIYRWVEVDEEVVVSYWQRSERVVRVDKVD